MKIEKINDNQIRCTLTREDLAHREIKLSELAYGTEKAKNLFHDMMLQAQTEFGFDTDNSPLMVEAIPVAPDSIVLIITKVEDPEELDSRFSRFTPDNSEVLSSDIPQISGADSIIDIFQKLTEARKKVQELAKEADDTSVQPDMTPVDLIHCFNFTTLDKVILAAHGMNGFFTGYNALYKDSKADLYRLILHQSGYSPEEFNKVCNILSEYAVGFGCSPAMEAHLREHGTILIDRQALQQLAEL